MKVQKIVSLTPHTAKLAENMPNFSAFVRNCLLNSDTKEEYHRQIMRRIRFERASFLLAETILDIYKEMGKEVTQTATDLVDKAYQQSRLEDFE